VGIQVLAFLLSAACGSASAAPPVISNAPPIHLNTVGYLPNRPKRASVSAPCTEFALVRASDKTPILRGTVTGPARNTDTAEDLFTADFSSLKEPGTYYLEIPGVGRSPEFRVGADVYNEPFRLVTRAM